VGELNVPADVPGETFFVHERCGEASRVGLRLQQAPIMAAQFFQMPRGTEAGRARAQD
jgi:hypothetical protein